MSKQNIYDLSGEYGIGYTSNGNEFYFDLEDYDKIKNYCWLEYYGKDKTKTEYGLHAYYKGNSNKLIKLHRLIMDVLDKPNIQVDHIKHNKHDNRKRYLRLVSVSENCKNRGKRRDNTSGTTGVSWDKSKNKWVAQIYVNKKNHNLGAFVDIKDAIKARKEAEEKYFGEYSYDNSMKL